MVEELTERGTDLMASLDAQPDTTSGLVEFMRYFDECGEKIEELIAEVDVAYQCFTLMDDFHIFVDEPEKESYMGKDNTTNTDWNGRITITILLIHSVFYRL